MQVDGQLAESDTSPKNIWSAFLSLLFACVLFLAFGLLGLAVGVLLYQIIIAPPKRLTIILLVIWDVLIFVSCGYLALTQIGADMVLKQSKELLLVLVACGVIFQAMLSQYQLSRTSRSKDVAYKSALAAVLTVVATAGLGDAFYGVQVPLSVLAVFALLFFTLSILLRLFVAPSFSDITKRMLDVGISLAALMVLAPFVVAISLAVLKTGRPIFFGHDRVGLDGKAFRCYKFRSMVPNAREVLQDLLEKDSGAREEWERDFKLKNDPRITHLGQFLRRTSLDEIPQLWNVLKGDMSLVGPRPITHDELKKYGKSAKHYLKTKPGITGLWQVSGRNDIDYETRVGMDRWYSKNWTVMSDLFILVKTVRVVFGRSGAY